MLFLASCCLGNGCWEVVKCSINGPWKCYFDCWMILLLFGSNLVVYLNILMHRTDWHLCLLSSRSDSNQSKRTIKRERFVLFATPQLSVLTFESNKCPVVSQSVVGPSKKTKEKYFRPLFNTKSRPTAALTDDRDSQMSFRFTKRDQMARSHLIYVTKSRGTEWVISSRETAEQGDECLAPERSWVVVKPLDHTFKQKAETRPSFIKR